MKNGLKKKAGKVGALMLALSMIVGLMTSIPGGVFAIQAKAESYISEDTTIVYGTNGGDTTVLKGTYAAQGDALTAEDSTAADGAVKWTNAQYHSTNYGVVVKNGSSVAINVKGNTKISIVTSQYNTAGKMITAESTDNSGTFEVPDECKVAADKDKLTVNYTAGSEETATVTLKFGGTVYVSALIIEPVKEPTYLEAGTTTKVTFTGSIDTSKAGDYSDDLNDLMDSAYQPQASYLNAKDLKQANEAIVLSGAKYHGTGYGIYVPANTTLDVNVAGSATVTMIGSVYSDAADITAVSTDSKGRFENSAVSGKTDTDKTAITFKYTGKDKATLTFTFGGNTYVGNIVVAVDEAKEEPSTGLDTSKIDVWDFGAEALDTTKYNNNFTADVINSFYSVPGGTAKVNIASFTAKDAAGKDAVKFNDGGFSTTHRWRTTNTALTRYDAKSLTDKNGTTYTGYLYANKSSTDAVNLQVYLYTGDIFKAYLGSNGNAALYKLLAPSGDAAEFQYTAANKAEEATFYAAEEGWYTLWCTNEKLVCGRLTREHVPTVTVSGSVTAPASIPSGYKLVFTNTTTKGVTEADVNGGSYSVSLAGKYSYDVSLKDANGFVVSASCNNIALDASDMAKDINIEGVSLVTISGNVTGIDADKLGNMKLTFKSDNVFVPELNIDSTGAYTLKVEGGVTYTVSAEGVNDFTLDTTSISATSDTTKNIEFTKKPVYPVTVKVQGVADTTGANVTFTNINEDGYSYTFDINSSVELRDGQYSVKIGGIASVPVVQGATADVVVNGAGAEVTIPMNEVSEWDFAKLNSSNEITAINGVNYYVGLTLTSNIVVNKTYLLANGSSSDAVITVPNVKKGSEVTIEYCYSASFTAGDVTVDEKSGSTSRIDSVKIAATEDGDFVITTKAGSNASQTYFCSITVKEQAEYKSVLYVGTDKEFATVSDALDAARKMTRTSDQEVTIMIDPGNYEEMLVIDIPNIKLQNASKNPSIALNNKGVGIDENAVRITWYYGHGYTYYSMGSDCKYDAALLAANKANGYASFTNPGAGTTNGSYWNATVVINADGFSADGIIFENSFNQYVSAKSVEDVIEKQAGAKEGSAARSTMKTVGDTKVQEKEYVERAAALAIGNDVSQTYFNNCKFIGRQDTLYGGTGATAAFNKCDVLGGTDYIFGGMTAVFKSCNLVFNTNDQTDNGKKNDVGYITAPQQKSGRGYLMYECRVTSTTPGVDTASTKTSKPGYLGRPWQPGTGEAVFYKTTVDAVDSYWNTDYSYGESMISAAGWLTSLGGESALCGEYGTIETAGVDNSAKRASWAKVFTKPELADGSAISVETFLGSWNPFGDDNGEEPEKPTKPEKPTEKPTNPTQPTTGSQPTTGGQQPSTQAPTTSDNVKVVPDENGEVPVKGVEVSSDVKFTDKDGKEIASGTVSIKAGAIADTDKSELQNKINSLISSDDVKGMKFVDISALVNNVKVTVSNGTLTISIRIDESIDYNSGSDIIRVFHKTDAGIVEHAVTKGDDRNISFKVNSLSPFAIVVSKGAEGGNNDDSDDGNDEKETTAQIVAVNPAQTVTQPAQTEQTTEASAEAASDQNVTSAKTGDTAPIALLAIIAGVCACAIAFSTKKRAR